MSRAITGIKLVTISKCFLEQSPACSKFCVSRDTSKINNKLKGLPDSSTDGFLSLKTSAPLSAKIKEISDMFPKLSLGLLFGLLLMEH